ncbi:MAG: YihY/virulence factor BrkB family protein [Acidimicrobiia bacterium]
MLGRLVGELGPRTDGPDRPGPDAACDPPDDGGPAWLGGRARSLVAAARRFGAEAADDRITGVAAEVAFYAFLGIFPGLLALAAALGFLEVVVGAEVARQAERLVVDFLADFLGDRASGTVEAVESLFDGGDAAVLSFATAGAVWSMWRATRAAMRALTVVYDVDEGRSALRLGAVSLAVSLCTLVVTVLMLVMFVVGPLFGGGGALARVVGLGDVFAALWTWARLPVGFALLVAWAMALFHLASHRRSLWAELPGAVATGALWLAFSGGFQLYLRVVGGANQVFGVIGGVMSVLLWLYLLSLALLLGAELNAVVAIRREEAAGAPAHAGGR